MSSIHSSPTSSHTSSGGSDGTASAAAAASARARLIAQLQQQKATEEMLKYYAAAVLGLILVFSIFHWTRYLYNRSAPRNFRNSSFMRAQVSIARAMRHSLTHRVPGFTSVGHALLVLVYLVINVVLTVVDVDLSPSNVLPIAKRLGSISMVNALFITFLALKNTPLAFLTAYSYERLNILHQVGGYTTVLLALLHMIFMLYAWIVQKKRVSILEEGAQINGMIAMAGMFIMMMFALLIRRVRYELFYVSHIVGYIIVLITVGLHRPDIQDKTLIITAIAAGIWGSDRVLRGMRIIWYSYDNRATVMPLSNGGTRMVISRSPSRSVSGTHCFIWIPKIRLLESHPFTIVRKTPNSLELVISKYDGFTKDLHNYALKHPGAALRASFDGPYGSLPDFSKIADKIVLVAGGTGASFTFGVALDTLKRLKDRDNTTIDFIWTVRDHETLSWFQKELDELRANSRVNLIVHTTRPSNSTFLAPASPTSPVSTTGDQKRLSLTVSKPLEPADGFSDDLEKSHKPHTSPWDSMSSLVAISGRPDVEKLIREVVSRSSVDERIVIAACGPEALMNSVRRTAAQCITIKGPSVELHCEQFGW